MKKKAGRRRSESTRDTMRPEYDFSGGVRGATSARYKQTKQLKDGAHCTVVAGTHKGKSGTVGDIKTSKTGHVTITVTQKNGVRFKTLAKNVVA